MPVQPKVRAAESGTALVEFALCLTLFWLPLFLGTIQLGLSFRQAIQVTQVCRDVSHMYASGIDFSQPSAQALLPSIAPGIDLSSTSKTATIILSTITKIGATDCSAAKVSPCPNQDQDVVTRRIVIPASSTQMSAFGTPNAAAYQDATSGVIKTVATMNNTTTLAASFSSVLPSLGYDQYSYVAEIYVQSPNYHWWVYLGTPNIAERSIF